MNSEDYFSNRTIQDEEKVRTQSLDVEAEVINAYKKAQSYLTGEVKKLYRRYLSKSGKTEAEVKQILNTTAEPSELVRLKGLTKDITNDDLRNEAKSYLNGLAVKSRITRLETLKAKSYIVSKQVADVQLNKSTNFYVDVIQEAHNKAAAEAIIGNTEKAYNLHNDGKYKSFAVKDGKLVVELVKEGTSEVLDTVKVKKDAPITEFKELSTKYTKNILDSHWLGSNYSKRIWNDTDLLAKHLQEMFTIETMTGLSEREMVSILVKEFNASVYAARRLIRTEANYMANQAKLKGWKEHGVEKYMIVAVLDLRTSVICQGQDGKVYDIDKAQAGFNFPPFHPFCRSVVRAYFGEQSLKAKRTAIDRVTGEPMTITQGTNYKEWEKMLLDKHSKKDLEVAKAKIVNYKRDLEMYNKLPKEKKALKSFDDYQNEKYKNKKAKPKQVKPKEVSNFEKVYGKENYNKFKESLKTIPNKRFKELLEKNLDKLNFVKSNDSNYVIGAQVNLNNKAFVGDDSKKALQVVYHELGHAIDNLGSRQLEGDYMRLSQEPKYKLKQCIQKDLVKTFNDDLIEMNGDKHETFRTLKKMSLLDESAIVRKYKKLSQEHTKAYSLLSDMMESTRKFVEYPLGHGHGLKYWKRSGTQEAEFFAHMSEALVNDEAREVMYKTFPTASKQWEQMLIDILEGGN